jgi:hypothetical protein
MANKKPTKQEKFTIEEIFNWISDHLPLLKNDYKKAKKIKSFKDNPLPFELFCLMIFDKMY